MNFLEIINLSVGYIENNKIETILENVNFELQRGEVCTILGGSGSGKTTLLKAIAGLAPVLSGKIIIEGKDISNIPVDKRNIGYVPQDPTLFQHLSVYDNIAFGLKIRKYSPSKIRSRVLELAELAGITNILDKQVTQISGGQAQRVSLCRSLAPYPKLLLLDEPFSSLDTSLKWFLTLEFKKIQKELNITTIHVTHDHYEASLMADYVGIINNNRLAQFGSINDIKPINWQNAKILGYPNVLSPDLYAKFNLPEQFHEWYPNGAFLDPFKLVLRENKSADTDLQVKIVNKTQSLEKFENLMEENLGTVSSYWVYIKNNTDNNSLYVLVSTTNLPQQYDELYLSNIESAFHPF